MIIDSHAHYSIPNFDGEFTCAAMPGEQPELRTHTRESLLQALAQQGITGIVEIPIELESNQRVLDFCDRHPGFAYPVVGAHPTRVRLARWSQRKLLDGWAQDPRVRAIGETGLDFHQSRGEQHRLNQVRWLLYQIGLAHRKGLPLVLHIRQANKTALVLLTLCRPWIHGAVVHCFSGSRRLGWAYCKGLGFSLGIGGTLLQNNDRGAELRDTVSHMPLDRLLLETDSPYVLPDLKGCCSRKASRKVRNTSLILPQVLKEIARLQGCSPEHAEQVILSNTMKFYGLPQADFQEET